MVNPSVPARLWVLMARKAPRAVVLRRGPAEWMQVALWHTDTDEFHFGQWFKGKLIVEWCDLSPDGELLLYFAQKYNLGLLGYENGYRPTWTAISKPPYLTALALWPIGGTYPGGGWFADDRTVYLPGIGEPHPNHQPQGLTINPPGWLEHYTSLNRLEVDGWTLMDEGAIEKRRKPFEVRWLSPVTWQKPSGQYTLVLMYEGPDYPMRYRSAHFYAIARDGQETLLPDVQWANWDQQGRLVGVRNGIIIVLNPDDPAGEVQTLADFNPHKPQQIVAPDWAQKW